MKTDFETVEDAARSIGWNGDGSPIEHIMKRLEYWVGVCGTLRGAAFIAQAQIGATRRYCGKIEREIKQILAQTDRKQRT